MNSIQFEQNVVNILENQKNNIESRVCRDQYVGKISRFIHTNNDFNRTFERPENVDVLILILESPHIDEYKGSPAPAKGKTGQNIRKYLEEILRNNNINNDYEVLIMNAIQYQCSLGKNTKCYRNEIFINVWENEGKNNFQDRLSKIVQENDIVINGCTKGNAKSELRVLVQQVIENSVQENIDKYRINHPSSWWKEINRKLKHVG